MSESAYRRDVQGLRAVAVLLVALDHAGVSHLSGGYVGVDVFFVLSGFLITGLLLSGVEKHGHVSFVDFYIRRAKRILPAATLTLVATTIAAYFLLNVVRAREAVWDSIWASLFAANVHFAHEGTDYFAQGQPPSPIQHFWSLSVEEQFYFVWPTLLAVTLFGAPFVRFASRRRRSRDARRTLGARSKRRLLAVTMGVAGLSLAWSILRTDTDPTGAYFSTLTRAWELALGALLAIAGSLVVHVPSTLRRASSWIGLAAIGVAAATFSETTAFPGYAALLPTLGAALVIVGGTAAADVPRGAGRILSTAPFRYVGDRSYAFYLWHWPVLVIAAQYVGRDLSLGANLGLLAGAFALSMASYALVENPIRRSDWTPSVTGTLLPASVAAVAVTSMLALSAIDAKLMPGAPVARAAASNDVGGARILPAVISAVHAARRGEKLPTRLTPPVDRLLDSDSLYSFPDGCAPVEDEQTSSDVCRLGDSSSKRSIVVFGDSHAQMWMPLVLEMARRDGWAVIPLVKYGCIPSTWDGHGYPRTPAAWLRTCRAWYAWASEQARSLRPDVVLLTGCCAGVTGATAADTIRVYGELTAKLRRVSKHVIVLGDPEGVDEQPVDCLLGRNATMRTCTTTRSDVHFALNDGVAALSKPTGYRFLDVRGWFCFEYECPMVIGGTVVYRDVAHITPSYATTLLAPFSAAFRRCVLTTCPR